MAKEADYYSMLGISQSSTQQDVKRAYHRALLKSHPDKSGATALFDIALLKDAYNTLISPQLRKEYDARTSSRPVSTNVNPKSRPAQIMSLEEFEQDEQRGEWIYGCRCGALYRITEAQMDEDVHLVGCEGCSEVVWVGYEAVDEE